MGRKRRKLYAYFIAFCMALSMLFPSGVVYANGDQDGQNVEGGNLDGQEQGDGNPSGQGQQEDEYNIDFGPDGSFDVNGTTVYIYFDPATVENREPVKGFNKIQDDTPIYLSSYDGDTMDVCIYATDGFSTRLAVDENLKTSVGARDADVLPFEDREGNPIGLEFRVEPKRQEGPGPGPGPDQNDREAVINVKGLEYKGKTTWTGVPGTERWDGAPAVTVDLNKTWTAVSISVNDNWAGDAHTRCERYEPGEDDRLPAELYEELGSQRIRMNRGDDDEFVSLDFFLSSWGDEVYALKINGVDYTDQLKVDTDKDGIPDTTYFDDRYSWLLRFRDQGTRFSIKNVPVNEKQDGDRVYDEYNVEIAIAPNEECYIGNFGWSNNDYFAPEPLGVEPSDLYIGHSTLTLLSVDYFDGDPDWDFDKDGLKHLDIKRTENPNNNSYAYESNDEINYIHYELDRPSRMASDIEVETSEMVIPEGSWVTMKIEPDYGYQVVSFNVTEDEIKLDKNAEGASVFSFKVGKGNYHIGAQVVEVGNDAKVDNAENIDFAMVELPEGTIETGTARLTVEDANPNADKKAEFEQIAEDEGLEIENYLDINLDQVFFQGTGNDEDVWKFPMEDLENPAQVGLQLGEGLLGDDLGDGDLVVIHNIHDEEGDFEVLDTELVEENGKVGIVFDADSFSGYAIARKKKDVKEPGISYVTHVQSYGWQGKEADPTTWKADGKLSGTVGESKRLEAIRIKLNDAPYSGGIEYRTHVQTYGWQKWVKDGELSGTSGQAKRLEAIQIRLTGDMAKNYDVYYRVQAQTYGWLGWAKNGEYAGTSGQAKRLEAIQIVIVKKGTVITGNTEIGGVKLDKLGNITASTKQTPGKGYVAPMPDIQYATHVQSYGWQGYVKNGAMSGTSGQAKRLEGIRIKLGSLPYEGGVRYTTHIQSIGWQDNENYPTTWTKDGNMSGTSGQAKRLEAIRINLYGDMAEHYDIYYRVHAQSYGWLGWAKNGEAAGTAGYAKRLEGIQIVLVEKGKSAPGKTYNGITANNDKAYISK